MKGSMDDITGRVWTWMASHEGSFTVMEIMTGVKDPSYDRVLDAVMFWADNDELDISRYGDNWRYAIRQRKDPEQ